jgi:hypothetical protein
MGCVAALAVALAAGPAAAQEPSAVRILLDMKRTYGACLSYRDRGEVSVRGFVEGGSFGSTVPFATAFVRGGAFRFQLIDRGLGERESRLVLWAFGDQVRAWWEAAGGERAVPSLQAGLEAAAGVSGGASLRVPGLLLPGEVRGGLFLSAPERLPDQEERGVACYRLRGGGKPTPYPVATGSGTVTVEDEQITVWVDLARLVLRKVEETRTLSTYRTVTVTLYEPDMNVPIPAEDLAFGPEGQ